MRSSRTTYLVRVLALGLQRPPSVPDKRFEVEPFGIVHAGLEVKAPSRPAQLLREVVELLLGPIDIDLVGLGFAP